MLDDLILFVDRASSLGKPGLQVNQTFNSAEETVSRHILGILLDDCVLTGWASG